MAYEQNPLKYSREQNMPGLEYSREDIAQKKRIATNSFGDNPPADLQDGEFFLKNNDPETDLRTLYISKAGELVKLVTIRADNTPVFPGINEVDLSTDEVVGKLPLEKLSTGEETESNNIQSLIVNTNDNNIKVISNEDFKANNSKYADNMKYNIVDTDSPINSVLELPYGYSILIKTLQKEPEGIRNEEDLIFPYICVLKEKRSNYQGYAVDLYKVFKSDKQKETFTVYALGQVFTNVSPEIISWVKNDDFENKPMLLDLSYFTEVSNVNTYENSKSIIMSDNNGIISKVAKESFILPVENGGTGVNSLVGIKTAWTTDEFFKLLGLTKPVHTNEIILKINTLYKESKGYFVLPFVWQNDIYNLPDNYGGMVIVFIGNNNNGRITYYSPSTFAEYVAKATYNQSAEFIKVRNADGSIPYEIGGISKHTQTSQGLWVETMLENNKKFVSGFGITQAPNGLLHIDIPIPIQLETVSITGNVLTSIKDDRQFIVTSNRDLIYSENKARLFARVNGVLTNCWIFWKIQGITI